MKSLFRILPLLLPSAICAQTITVFTNRAAFEAAMGSFKVVDGFSLGGTYLGVTTKNGAINGAGKWADIARDPEPSTIWATPFGSTAFGGTWDMTVSGVGGGLAFDLDFGGGNIVSVPGNIPGNSPADVFFGFTASQPFFNVRERQINSAGNTLQETHTLDDLTVQVPAEFADALFTQAGHAGGRGNMGHPRALESRRGAGGESACWHLPCGRFGSDRPRGGGSSASVLPRRWCDGIPAES